MLFSLLAFALQASTPAPEAPAEAPAETTAEAPAEPQAVAEQVEQAEATRDLAQSCIDRPADYEAALASRAAGTHDPSLIVLVHYETARAAGLPHCNGE